MHAKPVETVTAATPRADQLKPIILVVEDEELVRLSAAEYLTYCDFQVVEAATADDAVAMLSSGVVVDFVFSDIRMPGRLDGYGLAQWLSVNRPELPVLLTTGFAGSPQEPRKALPMLPKPYSFDGLRRKINEMLPEPNRSLT